MKSKWLFFTVGCVAGYLISLLAIENNKIELPQPDPSEVAGLQERIAELEQALEEANSDSLLAATTPAKNETANGDSVSVSLSTIQGVTLKGSNGTTASSVFMAKGFEDHMERRIQREVSMYKRRLGLSDEQAQAFEDLLRLRFKGFQYQIENAQEGQGLDVRMNEAHVTEQDIVDLAEEILSEDQLAEFQAIKQEESNSRKEMMATAQLGQISPLLGLDDDQKDAMYSLFFNEASSMIGGSVDRESLEEVRDFTNQEAEKFLTPEQFEQFKEMRQDQAGGVSLFIAR